MPHASGPRDVAESFEAAIARGDGEAAYALLGDEARARVDREQFVRSVGQSRRRAPLAVSRTDFVATSGSEPRAFVGENGEWRLDAASLVVPWDQSTPDSAIDSLLRAWEMRRYDIVLRFVPDEAGASIDEAALRAYCEGPERSRLDRLFAELREPTRERSQTTGEHAIVRFGEAPAKILRLVRQGREWKVVEIVP